MLKYKNMDAMERKMPSSIDYSDVLPLSVPAVSRRRKFYPVNGGEFSDVSTNEIRIPIYSTNALLDVEHSYLDFTLSNTNAPGLTFSPDAGGAAMYFSRVRVEQQGKVLSDTQEYNRLMASVLNPLTETGGGRLAATIKDFTQAGQRIVPGANNAPFGGVSNRGDRVALSNHGSGGLIDGGESIRLAMPLITGLFTQDKLVPLPLVDRNNPLTIVLTLDLLVNYGIYSALPVPGSMKISKICYNAQLVEVGGDVIQQFSMMRDMMGGQLALAGQDWEHNSTTLAGGAAGGGGERVVPIPVRKRSMKSLFWVANSESLVNTGLAGFHLCFNKSFGGACNMDSYQLKVGSVTYPPTPIQGPGTDNNAESQLRRGECLMELCKAIGTLSFSAPSGRAINTLTYCADSGSSVGAVTASGDNGVGGVPLLADGADPSFCSAFGLDLESFQHTAIESGVDSETMALQTNLILNIAAATIGAEDKTIHSWTCYDKQYYFNADGSVTMSD